MQKIFTVLLYFTPVLISNVHTYVLVAANLDDFKSLAKKFVPEKLAIQLADMAAASAVKYQREPSEEEREESAKEQDEENEAVDDDGAEDTPILARNSNVKAEKAGQSDLIKLSFEDLVQKVKERIQNDILKQQKLLKFDNNRELSQEYTKGKSVYSMPYKQNSRQDGYDNKVMLVSMKPKRYKAKTEALMNSGNANYAKIPAKKKKTYNKSPVTYKRPVVKINPNNDYTYEMDNSKAGELEEEDTGVQFAKVSMLKNDSYEDYVTPEKEKEQYESNEVKRKEERTQIEIVPVADNQGEKEAVREYENEEIRAVTEDLWFDYKEEHVTEEIITQDVRAKDSTKKGTLIPKRDLYKISSPNYVAKIPIVAERYDFNEPLPEKDREVKELKPIPGVVPYAVNGKIKLS